MHGALIGVHVHAVLICKLQSMAAAFDHSRRVGFHQHQHGSGPARQECATQVGGAAYAIGPEALCQHGSVPAVTHSLQSGRLHADHWRCHSSGHGSCSHAPSVLAALLVCILLPRAPEVRASCKLGCATCRACAEVCNDMKSSLSKSGAQASSCVPLDVACSRAS